MDKKLITAIATLALLSQSPAVADEPVTCHWTGNAPFDSSYSEWRNPGNWSEGVVPGLWREKVGDVWVTNGCRGCTAVFGKASSRAGSNYVRPKSSESWELLSIKDVRFEGADCSAYTFTYYKGWTWSWGTNPVKIEAGGGIYVAPEVAQTQIFEELVYGVGATGSMTCHVENNSAAPLRIYRIRRPVTGSNIASGWDIPSGWKAFFLRLQGTGTIKLEKGVDWQYYNDQGYWLPIIQLAMSGGKLVVTESMDGLFGFSTDASAGCRQFLELPAGVSFGTSYPFYGETTYPFEFAEDLLVSGGGSLCFLSYSGHNFPYYIAAGKTVEYACSITNKCSGTYKDEPAGLCYVKAENGTVRIAGANDVPGALEIGKVTFEVSTAGTVGGSGQLGKGQRVWLSGNGRLRYTGVGEISDKTIRLDGSNGAIENVGSGDLVFGGADSTAGAAVLTLSSVAGASVGFSGDVSAKLSLTDGATLSLCRPGSEPVSIVVSDMTAAGASTISVGDGVSATVSSLAQSGAGTVNVVTTGSGAIRLSSFAAGFAPAWITINGKKGVIGADGSLADRDTAADTATIDAHGGVVPNSASAVVGIATANGPAGQNVTLGADSTTVSMLRQRQAIDPATVEIGAAQTLSAAVVSVDAGAKPLAIGLVAGQGTVAPYGDSLEVEVKDAGGRLTVNAAVALPADRELAKTGAGTAEFAGGFSGTARIFEGAMKIDGADATSAELSGVGMFSCSGSPAGDLHMVAQEGRLALSGRIAGGSIIVASNTTAGLVVDGAAVTGRLSVACAQSANGFFHMKSGVFAESGDGINAGKSGMRYSLVSGGSYEGPSSGRSRIAEGNDEVLEVAGGTFAQQFVHASWYDTMAIGYGWGHGVLRITGGEVNLKGDITLPNIGDTGSGVITLDGPDAKLTFPSGRGVHIGMNNTTLGSRRQQVVNLNAGRLTASYVCTYKAWNNASQVKVVNFNGGVYNYTGNGSPFGTPGSDWEWPVDHVTVFAGGATIDTSSTLASVKVPMCAPTGKGLKSVGWTPVGGLAPGSHAVLVEDATGAGWGGTVFAQVSDAGVLTNMFVTSAGCDYTEGQTTARLRRKSGSSFQTIATFGCELEAQASGGFTKSGTGTLGLVATNTYTGATVVRQGTVRLDADDVINPESELVLDGGTLDMNGHAQTFSGVWVTANGGTAVNGAPQLSDLTVDCAAAAQRNYLRTTFPVSFAPGAELVLENVDAISRQTHSFTLADFAGGIQGAVRPELSASTKALIPENWSICYQGNRLRAVLDSGLIIGIR
ncbi:MAG: autotransporter-associated beta strand repeat-containing protein [Kiritimatiellae bacterium]|nr:autotransporter-associated beta strand repeat-containing protein [Kiritimatiellia bacterium]